LAELVLPFVVRIERSAQPTRTDALEAATRGVLLMLTDPRLHDHPAAAKRIRKVVRRARGAQWRRAVALDGLTVAQGSAEVRVFPPVPVDAWPPDLARLQVGGTDLEDPEASPVPPGRPLVLLSPRYEMTAGKAMVQAAHAAQLGWWQSPVAARTSWRDSGFPLAVRTASAAQWDDAVRRGGPVVQDAGFTEVEPGAETATVALPGL
jgi:peptidyl-tRNA hydrolase